MPEIAFIAGLRAARHAAERRDVRHPLPRHQHEAHALRPAPVARHLRPRRDRHPHRRGQLHHHRRRGRGRPHRHRVAVREPLVRAARRAPRSARRPRPRFEIDPAREDTFARELAQALLVRTLFPDSPIKYMPPTKHKQGDIFFSHAYDVMADVVAHVTGQEIQLLGMMTEAMHNPFLMDRFVALKAADYVRRAWSSMGAELVLRPGGLVERRADETLGRALALLEEVAAEGLVGAIGHGALRRRRADGGRRQGARRRASSAGPTTSTRSSRSWRRDDAGAARPRRCSPRSSSRCAGARRAGGAPVRRAPAGSSTRCATCASRRPRRGGRRGDARRLAFEAPDGRARLELSRPGAGLRRRARLPGRRRGAARRARGDPRARPPPPDPLRGALRGRRSRGTRAAGTSGPRRLRRRGPVPRLLHRRDPRAARGARGAGGRCSRRRAWEGRPDG